MKADFPAATAAAPASAPSGALARPALRPSGVVTRAPWGSAGRSGTGASAEGPPPGARLASPWQGVAALRITTAIGNST